MVRTLLPVFTTRGGFTPLIFVEITQRYFNDGCTHPGSSLMLVAWAKKPAISEVMSYFDVCKLTQATSNVATSTNAGYLLICVASMFVCVTY